MMKSRKITFFIFSVVVLARAGSSNRRFRGEVSDTQCAMNVHSLDRSHAEMIAKGTLGTDPASCAKACVRRGGEWVLRSGQQVFRLKSQAGVEQFAGQQVEIIGTLDSKTNTIDNTDIRLLPTKSGTSH
jgi:hypothetical protein